jgi:hypothetical protein
MNAERQFWLNRAHLKQAETRRLNGPMLQELRRARFARIRARALANPQPIYPVCADPNIIGEHEVPPVLCTQCSEKIPWAAIKGWYTLNTSRDVHCACGQMVPWSTVMSWR